MFIESLPRLDGVQVLEVDPRGVPRGDRQGGLEV